MIKTTLQIDGMACSMCETHVNNAIRQAFPVKKVTSSHKKCTTEILSKEPLDEQALTRTIADTGYTLQGITAEPYEKKGLFQFGR